MKRATVVAAAAMAVAALVAGCGSASTVRTEAKGGAAVLARSTQATQATKTARFKLQVTMSGADLSDGGDTTFEGDGAIDFESKAMDMKLAAKGQAIEERLVDGALYMKLPGELAKVTGGKSWVKLDLSQAGAMGGDPTGTGMTSDPGAMLQQLESVSKQVTTKQGPQIDGAFTTEYDAEVDLAKAAGKLDAEQRAAIDKLGLDTVPVKVFVDQQGRVVRIAESLGSGSGSSDSGAFPVGVEVVITFSDFGAPVDIAAPPADQVGDLKDLMKGLGTSIKEKFSKVGEAIGS